MYFCCNKPRNIREIQVHQKRESNITEVLTSWVKKIRQTETTTTHISSETCTYHHCAHLCLCCITGRTRRARTRWEARTRRTVRAARIRRTSRKRRKPSECLHRSRLVSLHSSQTSKLSEGRSFPLKAQPAGRASLQTRTNLQAKKLFSLRCTRNWCPVLVVLFDRIVYWIFRARSDLLGHPAVEARKALQERPWVTSVSSAKFSTLVTR